MRFTLTVWITEDEEKLFRARPVNLAKVRNQLAVGCEMLQLPADRGEIRREDTGKIVELV